MICSHCGHVYRAEGNFTDLANKQAYQRRQQGWSYCTQCPRCASMELRYFDWNIRRARDQVKLMLAPDERLIRINPPLEKETPDAEEPKA